MNVIKGVILSCLLLVAFPANALELIMFHSQDCGYCRQFDADFGGVEGFNKTELGKKYPMTVVDTTNPTTDWNGRVDVARAYGDGKFKIHGWPTFLIWDEVAGEAKIGFAGYGGPEHLANVLGEALKRIGVE